MSVSALAVFPLVARSPTPTQTKTGSAKKNLQDRWSLSITPISASLEEPGSLSTDRLHTTTEVATRVLKKEKSTRLPRKWTHEIKDRLQDLLDENKTTETILPILKSAFSMTLTTAALTHQITMIRKSKKMPLRICHIWTTEQKDRLRTLSKEYKSIKTIQQKLNLEFGLTLTVKSVKHQLDIISNKTPTKTHHVWTQAEKDLLRSLLDENKTAKTILPILESRFGITYTIDSITHQMTIIKKFNGSSLKTCHMWTEAQTDLLWRLSTEGKDIKTIQQTLKREFSITLTKRVVQYQLAIVKKSRELTSKPHQICTEEQTNRLCSLLIEGKKVKDILPILEYEFKTTFAKDTIKSELAMLKASKRIPRIQRKKWSQDDLKTLKDFIHKNTIAFQKGSVEKPYNFPKRYIQGIRPEEWNKLATTLNRTVFACLKAAYFFSRSQAPARPLDSYEEASHLAAAASEEELDQLNADLEKLLETDPKEFLEDYPLDVAEPLDIEAQLDYLDNCRQVV